MKFFLPALLFLQISLLAQPAIFHSTGIGGGGALFSRELLVGGWMVAVLILLVLILLK